MITSYKTGYWKIYMYWKAGLYMITSYKTGYWKIYMYWKTPGKSWIRPCSGYTLTDLELGNSRLLIWLLNSFKQKWDVKSPSREIYDLPFFLI